MLMVEANHRGRGLSGIYPLLLFACAALLAVANADELQGKEKCGRVKSGQDAIVAIGSHGTDDFVVVLKTGEIYLLPRSAIANPDRRPRIRLTGKPKETQFSFDTKDKRYSVLNFYDKGQRAMYILEMAFTSFDILQPRLFNITGLKTGENVTSLLEKGTKADVPGTRFATSVLSLDKNGPQDHYGMFYKAASKGALNNKASLVFAGRLDVSRGSELVKMVWINEEDPNAKWTIPAVDGHYPLAGSLLRDEDLVVLTYPTTGQVGYLNMSTNKLTKACLNEFILCGDEKAPSITGTDCPVPAQDPHAAGGGGGGGGEGRGSKTNNTAVIIGVVVAIALLALVGAVIYLRKGRKGSARLTSGGKSKTQPSKYGSKFGGKSQAGVKSAVSGSRRKGGSSTGGMGGTSSAASGSYGGASSAISTLGGGSSKAASSFAGGSSRSGVGGSSAISSSGGSSAARPSVFSNAISGVGGSSAIGSNASSAAGRSSAMGGSSSVGGGGGSSAFTSTAPSSAFGPSAVFSNAISGEHGSSAFSGIGGRSKASSAAGRSKADGGGGASSMFTSNARSSAASSSSSATDKPKKKKKAGKK